PAPRAPPGPPLRDVRVRQPDRREARPAVRRGEDAALAKARAAVLEGVALGGEILDAIVRRDRLGDLPTDGGGVLEMHEPRCARYGAFGEVHEDLPLGARLADSPAGDLRGEVHAPFRGRLRAAAALLVPRLRGEQEDLLRGLDEHRAREVEVLVDPERNASERLADVLGFGQRLEEVASRLIQDVEEALVRRVDHPDRRHAGSRVMTAT